MARTASCNLVPPPPCTVCRLGAPHGRARADTEGSPSRRRSRRTEVKGKAYVEAAQEEVQITPATKSNSQSMPPGKNFSTVFIHLAFPPQIGFPLVTEESPPCAAPACLQDLQSRRHFLSDARDSQQHRIRRRQHTPGRVSVGGVEGTEQALKECVSCLQLWGLSRRANHTPVGVADLGIPSPGPCAQVLNPHLPPLCWGPPVPSLRGV